MRIKLGISAMALSIAISASARADEAEVLAHYDAYEAAMAQLRYDVAEQEAEAAWRGAEETWGGVEDTAVLAFNLVRVRLMGDRRAEAVEPALRIAELAASGNAQSVTPAEVRLFTTLAQFDAQGASGGGIGELEDALDAYEPTDYVGKRIALLGWGYAANGRFRLDQHYDSQTDAQNALALAAQDPIAPPALVGAVGLIAARAGYETGEIDQGIQGVLQAIASFPTQPAGQPIDPSLASLLVWNQGLNGLHMIEEGRPYAPSDPALLSPKWDDGRYATEQGCMVTWADRETPGRGGPRAEGIGAVLEYRLNADGTVADVTVSGGDPNHPGADLLRGSTAEPPASEACQGPYLEVQALLFPRDRSSGARSGQ